MHEEKIIRAILSSFREQLLLTLWMFNFSNATIFGVIPAGHGFVIVRPELIRLKLDENNEQDEKLLIFK